MALRMLVNGADCGPSNPLQNLSKRFDHDRGVQQDHIGAGRAASARQTFRTQQQQQQQLASGFAEDAASFFSGEPTASTRASAFDLSALQQSLLSPPQLLTGHAAQLQLASAPLQQLQQQNTSSWATDFLHASSSASTTSSATAPQIVGGVGSEGMMQMQQDPAVQSVVTPQGGVQWNPVFSGNRMNQFANFAPPMSMLAAATPTVQAHHQHNQSLWDQEFQSQENALTLQASAPLSQGDIAHQPQQQQRPTTTSTTATPLASQREQDELARTAMLLVESVKGETNPKFQNSQFLGLMRQLRDGEVIVEGDKMVDASDSVAAGRSWQGDVKGKRRAVDVDHSVATSVAAALRQINSARRFDDGQEEQEGGLEGEDANDAYFRQENEEYVQYWNEHHSETAPAPILAVPPFQEIGGPPWGHLQEDWDRFEATASGIREVDNYQFQTGNPYLIGDSSRTRHHAMHMGEGQRKTVYESVLELEAAVQRDPTDAGAWFELGVKQQENEREQKAIQALRRAIEIDGAHLPSWLALAVSHTNDGDRAGTYDAIREWVGRNARYADTVAEYRRARGVAEGEEGPEWLIGCLIAMAQRQSGGGGDGAQVGIDADVQVALAILLNTNEDYGKARDCFRTALELRPDDWILYNRVGATLANSGHAEEALQYYYRALELNPRYIRARFNLGISCSNLRQYEEAAQHFLDALVLQDSDGVRDGHGMNDARGVTSTALWETLRTTCLHMQNIKLAALCDRRDLDGFREAFHG